MSDRLKIVHLITGLDTGGAETNLQRLTAAMDRTQFENVVISLTEQGPLSAVIRSQGIKVEAIRMSRSLPSPTSFWRLYRLLQVERPNILHTWLYHADFFGLLAGRLARVPSIVWNIRCSNMGKEYNHGINGALLRMLVWLSKFPDAIVANSHAGLKEHTSIGYDSRHWTVLENGFDLDVFKPDVNAPAKLRDELDLPAETFLIGLVARYDPMKDHKGFLKAAANLRLTNPEVHFVLAGGGIDSANKTLNTLIDQLEIRDRIHLLGRRNDVPELTAGLDIATCCSLGEGFPNIVGEAMACAVPCVVTDVGDAARIVGPSGIIVPAGDPTALTDAWRKMIDIGKSGRVDLGQEALARIKLNYSLVHCVDRYQKFYEEIACGTLHDAII